LYSVALICQYFEWGVVVIDLVNSPNIFNKLHHGNHGCKLSSPQMNTDVFTLLLLQALELSVFDKTLKE